MSDDKDNSDNIDNIIPFPTKSKDDPTDLTDEEWLKGLFATIPTITMSFEDLESFMLDPEENPFASPFTGQSYKQNELELAFLDLSGELRLNPEMTEFVTAQLKKITEMVKKS